MDICSAIVYSHTSKLEDNVSLLKSINGVDVHDYKDGKIIITVEDYDLNNNLIKASDTLTKIQLNNDFLSVILVSQYSDC